MRFKLILGLGNPEEKYHATYHNAGRLFVEWAATQKGCEGFKKVRNFSYCKAQEMIFAYPDVAMNLSGEAAKAAAEYFHIAPEALVIAHDDSDMYRGDWKLSFEKGAAGHHGIESIIAHFHTQAFYRIRIGIREKIETDMPRKKASEFVLSPITKHALSQLHETFPYCLAALEKETANDTPDGIARIELKGTETPEN